jgi:hypothetical protein
MGHSVPKIYEFDGCLFYGFSRRKQAVDGQSLIGGIP